MVLGHSAEPRAHCHDHKRLHSVQECVPGGPWGGGEGNEEEGREMGRRGEGKRSESYLKAGSACAERRVEAHSSNPFAAYNDMCHGHCYHGYTSTHSSM